MSTTDTVEITYPGPHHQVYVPGTPDIATAGEPVAVERGLAQRLVNEGWQSDTLTAETATPAPVETADAPPQAETPLAAPAGTETPTSSLDAETAVDPTATPSLRRR